MTVAELLMALENTPLGTAVRESAILFPWLEAIHVIAVTFVLGAIAVIDARLLGCLSRDEPVSRLTEDLVPWVWGAFVLALLTGAAMFSGSATKYFGNFYFQAKMVLLLAAGVNMAFFHKFTCRDLARWDEILPPPGAARWAGAVSLILWLAVVALGRLIGFSLN
jgi:hypothetical protein